MTPKELLYVEDALGHEQFFEQKCKEIADKIEDKDLKNCVNDMVAKHKTIFNNMYKLV